MKHITLALGALAGAISLALAAPAGAQTRDDIMESVIWPCVDHEVQELDLQEHHADAAATIMFELDRDYYEEVIDAVEAAFREEPNDSEEWNLRGRPCGLHPESGLVVGRGGMKSQHNFVSFVLGLAVLAAGLAGVVLAITGKV